VGRWADKEPLGFNAETNFYRYCGNDPVNFVDLDGNELVMAGAGAFIGGLTSVNKYQNYYMNGAISGSDLAMATFYGASMGALNGLLPGAGAIIGGIIDGIVDDMVIKNTLEAKMKDNCGNYTGK